MKGLRAIQLYLPNNPVYQKAVENIRKAFEPVWQYTAELQLVVTETAMKWEGHVVLDQTNKSESVAWVLFKDGVRGLLFLPGVEDAEMERFLHVVHKGRTLDADAPDDLLTLLWEQDFQSIRYDYIELGMDDVPTLEKSETIPPQRPPEELRQEVEEEEQERPEGIVSMEDFDATLYFLDQDEIRYLQDEIEREYKQDLRGNVLSMLFDLMELQTYTTVRAELISILENFIPYLLAVGDFHSVAYILREIRVVLQRARELLPEHGQQLEDLPARLSEPEALGQLLQSLDEALVHPTEEELGELFRELRPEALETVLAWLPKLTNERVRGLLDAAAKRLAQAHPDELVDALEATEEAVLLETIRVAAQLKLPPVVPALGRLFEGDNATVKRTAMGALTKIGTPGAMQQLERAVSDGDREVRVGAVRALASAGHRNALPLVEAALSGKQLRNADLTEKTAFFEAYGTLAGESGLATLTPLIETKGFMRRKEDPETRACAAMALGKIGTPEARKALEKAADDKEPLVRNAVRKAMREIAG
ncbi:MAG: HEAT repeat domain-containing protein [Gemmatimonadales bacterium]